MSANKRNLAMIVLLFVCATIIFLFRGDYAITLSFADDVFTVDGPQGMLFSAKFEDIASIKLLDTDFDRGEKLSGGEQYGYIYGEYQNKELGRYQLCTQKRVTTLMLVVTKDGRAIAFGCENNETMVNLYRSVSETMAKKGYDVITE